MVSSSALTKKPEIGTPYQLDQGQILRASRALLKHMKDASHQDSSKKSLLADADSLADEDTEPIWLTLTTKTHIVDAKRLKPSLVSVPHPLRTSPTITVCLITADPQRTYKDIIASDAFPVELSKRITRVIGLTKLQAKYKTYEAQRQLYAEHDVFLADDRIITRLAKSLGKTFYKTTVKRPVPVNMQAPAPRTDGKRVARAKSEKGNAPAGSAAQIAREVEKALKGALVHLSASTTTAIRVGYMRWDEKQIADNVEVVANEVVERFVPKKWKGIKAIHIKGPATAALPIWLADELWVDEGDIVEEVELEEKANVGKKRKAIAVEAAEEGVKQASKKIKKSKSSKEDKKKESDDTVLDTEIATRKAMLRKQKEAAAKDVENDIPKSRGSKDKSKSKAKSKMLKAAA